MADNQNVGLPGWTSSYGTIFDTGNGNLARAGSLREKRRENWLTTRARVTARRVACNETATQAPQDSA